MDEEINITFNQSHNLEKKLKFLKELNVHITTSGKEKGLNVEFLKNNAVNIYPNGDNIAQVQLKEVSKDNYIYADEKCLALIVDWKTPMPDSYYFFYSKKK